MERQITPRYVSVADWVKLCGLSKTKVHEMISEGRFRSIKLDRRRLIDVEASRAYLESLSH